MLDKNQREIINSEFGQAVDHRLSELCPAWAFDFATDPAAAAISYVVRGNNHLTAYDDNLYLFVGVQLNIKPAAGAPAFDDVKEQIRAAIRDAWYDINGNANCYCDHDCCGHWFDVDLNAQITGHYELAGVHYILAQIAQTSAQNV